MILLQAINSARNYLKYGFNPEEKQGTNKDWTTIEGMECQRISTLLLFQKANFNIQITEEGTVIYQQDGSILYIDQKDTLNQTKNLEQIKYLRWHGQYGNRFQKIGKWYASWKGEYLEVGGMYCNQGLKTGNWIELFENFWDKSQVTFIGQYCGHKKQGKWQIYYFDQKLKQITNIGGGYYDQVGIKQGYWIDLHRNFYDGRQIIYKGNYYNGVKEGWWDISFQSYFDSRFKKIGGGFYNRYGKKNGKWVQEFENFWNGCQILEKGEYNNGLKIGNWEYLLKEQQDDNYKIIGLGCYDIDRKNGKWIEIHDKFMSFIHSKYYVCKLVNIGIFKEGLKKGKWISVDQSTQNVIGGGDYDENGQKTDVWLDVENYRCSVSKISFQGIYKNGKKEGKWQINCNVQKIGGGNYNERGLKFGQWIEISEKFWEYCKVLFQGNYQEGIKIGKWEILLSHGSNVLEIGGGNYDDNGIKIGQWTELSETFWDNSQVSFKGQYSNGIKYGRWDTLFTTHALKQQQLIGGGMFDKNGVKFGKWIDLHEYFANNLQLIYVGIYKNGIKQQEFQENKLKLFQ